MFAFRSKINSKRCLDRTAQRGAPCLRGNVNCAHGRLEPHVELVDIDNEALEAAQRSGCGAKCAEPGAMRNLSLTGRPLGLNRHTLRRPPFRRLFGLRILTDHREPRTDR